MLWINLPKNNIDTSDVINVSTLYVMTNWKPYLMSYFHKTLCVDTVFIRCVFSIRGVLYCALVDVLWCKNITDCNAWQRMKQPLILQYLCYLTDAVDFIRSRVVREETPQVAQLHHHWNIIVNIIVQLYNKYCFITAAVCDVTAGFADLCSCCKAGNNFRARGDSI